MDSPEFLFVGALIQNNNGVEVCYASTPNIFFNFADLLPGVGVAGDVVFGEAVA